MQLTFALRHRVSNFGAETPACGNFASAAPLQVAKRAQHAPTILGEPLPPAAAGAIAGAATMLLWPAILALPGLAAVSGDAGAAAPPAGASWATTVLRGLHGKTTIDHNYA